jgi:hypothetical protein
MNIYSKDLQDKMIEYSRMRKNSTEFNERMKALSEYKNSSFGFQEAMRNMMESKVFALDNKEQIQALLEISRPMVGVDEAVRDSFSKSEFLLGNWLYAYDKTDDNFIVNNDGTVSANQVIITQDDIENTISHIIDQAIANSSNKFEILFNELIKEIKALKNSAFEKFLTWLLFPLIVGFILSSLNPITGNIRNEEKTRNRKQLQKQINQKVVENVENKDLLKVFRIVVAVDLNVREKKTIHSKVISVLPLGAVVKIAKKDNNWSLITWRDNENNLIVQGWVFSRYLRKFQ